MVNVNPGALPMTVPGKENDLDGNQGHFQQFRPLFCRKSRQKHHKISPYYYDSMKHFHFTLLSQGIEDIFSEKYYFYHFMDAFEFYTGVSRGVQREHMCPWV